MSVKIPSPEKLGELLTRGVEEVIPQEELERDLREGKPLRVKLGIDPTSPNIHLGRAVQLLKLRDFQALGHTIVLIIGDATGVVGDTSDKLSERPMLSPEQVAENAKTYLEQVGKLLDMERVEVHRNSEWLDRLTYRDIGEQADQFSLSDFIARDNIRRRLEAGTRVSLREVLYPLMQGYDSVAIRSSIELGGTDQRFNLLAGRGLQLRYGQPPQCVMMTTLIEGLDGRKMSSSWGNTVNLTDAPAEMFGKVMRLHDDLLERYFVTTTRVPMPEVREILAGHPRDAKLRLAREIVTLYHAAEAAGAAERDFIRMFSEGGVPEEAQEVSAASGALLSDVLVHSGVVSSKTEFRRLIDSGAIADAQTQTRIEDPLCRVSGPLTLKVGKRRFLKINVK